MKRLLLLLLTALLTTACGSTHLFEFFDLRNPGADAIVKQAAEHKTLLPASFVVTNPSGDIAQTPLRSGTPLRVLAGIAQVPHYDASLIESGARPGSYNPDTYYIVELADGTRAITQLPDLAVGQQVHKAGDETPLTVTSVARTGKKSEKTPYPYRYTCDDGKSYAFAELRWKQMRLPMYSWLTKDPRTDVAGCIKGEIAPNFNRFFTAEKLDKAIVGKPFAEVERTFGPAMQITRTGQTRTALYPNVSLSGDNPEHLLSVTVEGSTATAYRMLAKERKTTGLMKAVMSLYGNSVMGNIVRHYDYWTFPRFAFFDTFRMGKIGRIVVDMLLCAVLCIALFYFLLISVTYPLMRIRVLSNEQVLLLRRVLYLLLSIGLIYLTGLYMNLIMFIVTLYLVYATCKDIRCELESDRCPYCHTVGNLCYQGEADKRTDVRKSAAREEKKVVGRKVERTTSTDASGREHTTEKVITKWIPVKRQTITVTRTWHNKYYCPDCGQVILYRDESTTEHDTEQVLSDKVRTD